MIHPVFIDDAQHYNALYLSHQRQAVRPLAEGLFLCGIDLFGKLVHSFAELIIMHTAAELLYLKRAAAHEELLKGLESVIELGLVLRHAPGKAVGHGGGDELLYHTHDLRVDILAVKHLASLAVDDVALLVHDVIVFEDALTGLEVAALDRALRLLDGVGEHLMVKRGVLIDLHRVHKAGEPVGAEETHDIVRQRKVEAALAGVALTAGTAAQLVIDTAGLVALGAEDEQAADGAHLFGLRVRLSLVYLHALGKQRARGEDVLIVRLGVAGSFGDGGLVIAGLAQVGLGHELGVAAEGDIGAAACHVRRYRNCAELTGLSDDLGFLFMVLGVEHRVRDTAALEQGGDIFALFY